MKIENIVGEIQSPCFVPIEQLNHYDNILFIRTQDSDPAHIDFKAKYIFPSTPFNNSL